MLWDYPCIVPSIPLKIPLQSPYLFTVPFQVSAPITGCKRLQSREGILGRSPVSDHKGETVSQAKGLMPKYHILPSNKWGQNADVSSTPYLEHMGTHLHVCPLYLLFFNHCYPSSTHPDWKSGSQTWLPHTLYISLVTDAWFIFLPLPQFPKDKASLKANISNSLKVIHWFI